MWHLRNNSSLVSLSVRLSPDLIVYKRDDTKFFELKTGKSKDIIRMEAYQLMLNQIREVHFHTPCIYVYCGNMSDNKMIACPSSKIIPSILVIPDVKKNEQVKPIIKEYFKCESIQKKIDPQYSGDAYIEVNDISNWESIDKYIRQ